MRSPLAARDISEYVSYAEERIILGPQEVQHAFQITGGFWKHNGKAKAPHAILRSKKHSDGFISVPAGLKHIDVCRIFGDSLAMKIEFRCPEGIDWVIGSDHAAATFSYSVGVGLADCLVEESSRLKHDFTEKTILPDGQEVQKWARHVIGPDEVVLQVEELCTTNLTLKRVREGIIRAHPDYPIRFAPFVAMLVNRTGSDTFEGQPIISLLEIKFNEWDPDDCPLCAGGSAALADVKKTVAQWERLTRGER